MGQAWDGRIGWRSVSGLQLGEHRELFDVESCELKAVVSGGGGAEGVAQFNGVALALVLSLSASQLCNFNVEWIHLKARYQPGDFLLLVLTSGTTQKFGDGNYRNRGFASKPRHPPPAPGRLRRKSKRTLVSSSYLILDHCHVVRVFCPSAPALPNITLEIVHIVTDGPDPFDSFQFRFPVIRAFRQDSLIEYGSQALVDDLFFRRARC